MSDIVRQTYVISDLHLGGVYPENAGAPAPGGATDRGFRICTHAADITQFINALAAKPPENPSIELIVNGDLVDFLAERDPDTGHFTSFNFKQVTAHKKFDAIVQRDQQIFDALSRFLARGHRLVILLGNHDIELTMPAVRSALAKAVGAGRGTDYEFVPGGEAYLVGDALIEHGNRYDKWNMVDHEQLQRVAVSLSRLQPVVEGCFTPPPGSDMVSKILNPIKENYKFVDLLKPETGAVLPLILTLEPGFASIAAKVALIAARLGDAVRVAAGLPPLAPGAALGSDISSGGGMGGGSFGSDISSGGFDAPAGVTNTPQVSAEDQALNALLAEHLGANAHEVHSVLATNAPKVGSDISTFGDFIDRKFGFIKLLISSGTDYTSRLGALHAVFSSLQGDKTFDEGVETAKEYMDAATALASNGIKHVVFGHTHMAKRIPLPSGGFYLNSGTWADVMQFPSEVLSGPHDPSFAALGDFVKKLVTGDFSSYALFRPTYVRLDLAADGSVTPALCRYADPKDV